jgi:hypothetical protein
MAVAQDLLQQSRPNRLARMDGHDGRAPVFVAQKVMAPSDPQNLNAATKSEPLILGLRLMPPR